MSIPVSLDALEKTLPEYDFAYLLTAAERGGPHAVAVPAVLVDGTFDVGEVGNRTRTNATANDEVTVLFPPRDRGGYSLIVDGVAAFAGDSLRVTPRRAVLHRPAAAATDCGSDCIELGAPTAG